MQDLDRPDGIVVPMDPAARDLAQGNPWQALATNRAALITWTHDPGPQSAWGPALRATSAVSKGLTELVTNGSLASHASTLFRVELPTGATLENLVPALGGGFRGLVRNDKGISGHARLVAAGGSGAVGFAALGPVLGLLAVTVGAEMLAQHQQDKKLKAISNGVQALLVAQEESTAAQLASAEKAIRLAASAMLDQLTIPSTIGFGSARDGLRQVRSRALTWLESWEKGAESLPSSGGVNVEKMQTILAGGGPVGQWRSFPRRLETLYRALALDSRAQVLTHAEATAQQPGQPLHYLEAEVGKDLAENAAAQQRVQSLLWELAAHPLTYKMPWSGTEAMGLDRAIASLASGMSRLPDAPQLLSSSGRQVIEMNRSNRGDLRLVAPTADATAS